MEEQGDPFHFLFNFCQKSSSQEQILQSIPFCREAAVNVADGGGSSQEQHDVYHTPPENSLASSSGHQPRDVDVVDLGDDDYKETECVNSDSGSALGFSKVEPRGIKRNAVDERELLQAEKTKLFDVKKKKSSFVFDVLRCLAEAEKARNSATATAADADVHFALRKILSGKNRG